MNLTLQGAARLNQSGAAKVTATAVAIARRGGHVWCVGQQRLDDLAWRPASPEPECRFRVRGV